MKQYLIDLSSLSDELKQKSLELLDDYAFICQPILGKPNLYDVYWEIDIPIEEKTKIPSKHITPID